MNDVSPHRRPWRNRLSGWKLRLEDSGTGLDWAFYIALVLSALICVGGAAYALAQTNGPGYDPPRNAYNIGGVR